MHQHSDALARDIARKAQELRIDVLEMVFGAQTGHLGGPFSAAEIVAALYFHHLRLDPARPGLARAGSLHPLEGPRRADPLRGAGPPRLLPARGAGDLPAASRPAWRATPTASCPGSRWSPGPLGHGVAVGAGMAWALSRGQAKPSAATAPVGPAPPGPRLRPPGRRRARRRRRLGRGHDRRQVPPRQPDRDRRLQRHPADRRDGRRHAHRADRRQVARLRLARPGGPRPQRARGPRRPRPGRRGPRPAVGDHRPHHEGQGASASWSTTTAGTAAMPTTSASSYERARSPSSEEGLRA